MTEPVDIYIATTIIRLGFGVLFLAAGVSKLLRLGSVEHILARYRLLPDSMLSVAARFLAAAEIIAGLMLLMSVRLPIYHAAWILTAGLLAVFSTVVLVTLARGITAPCGCALLLNGHVVTWATLQRNLLLLSLLVIDRLLQNGGSL